MRLSARVMCLSARVMCLSARVKCHSDCLVEVDSLAHDPDDDNRGTGYDVVKWIKWIEEQVVTTGFAPPAIRVDSANVSARKRLDPATGQTLG